MCRSPSTCPCHIVSDCGEPKSPTFLMNEDSAALMCENIGVWWYKAATESGILLHQFAHRFRINFSWTTRPRTSLELVVVGTKTFKPNLTSAFGNTALA